MTTMCEFQQTSPGSFRVFRQDATAHPEACPICLDEIEKDAYGLPCKHTFHAECLLTLRRSPNSQVCPLCRADLPPGPKELFEEAAVHYREIEARVNSGDADWEALDGQDRVKFDEVLRLWGEAARQGVTTALCNLGTLYARGIGVTKDEVEAAQWYKAAAERGHAPAQTKLGFLYVHGIGIEKDRQRGFDWFKTAAEQGYGDAQYNLGIMYLGGLGIEASEEDAIHWLTKSADQGDLKASATLAQIKQKSKQSKSCYGFDFKLKVFPWVFTRRSSSHNLQAAAS